MYQKILFGYDSLLESTDCFFDDESVFDAHTNDTDEGFLSFL